MCRLYGDRGSHSEPIEPSRIQCARNDGIVLGLKRSAATERVFRFNKAHTHTQTRTQSSLHVIVIFFSVYVLRYDATTVMLMIVVLYPIFTLPLPPPLFHYFFFFIIYNLNGKKNILCRRPRRYRATQFSQSVCAHAICIWYTDFNCTHTHTHRHWHTRCNAVIFVFSFNSSLYPHLLLVSLLSVHICSFSFVRQRCYRYFFFLSFFPFHFVTFQ